MTIASRILEKLSFKGFDDADLITEYKKCNIYKWNTKRGDVFVAVTSKDGDPAYVDDVGFIIRTSGVIHGSDWDAVTFKSEDEAKKAIDKYVQRFNNA